MDYLPDPKQRSALLESLSHLIEMRGFETFIRAPILEPTSDHFPDPWEPSVRGVRALSLRLLAYAGLERMDASVELYTEDRVEDDGRHQGTAAWFAGIDPVLDDETRDDHGVCRFGADTRQLTLGDSIVGTMCHEVAHAFREHHNLVGKHRQIEEEDTDVTTIYLGFGILTTNNAYRFRKSGGLSGAMVTTQWSTSHAGYLSPQAMAFMLAAQAIARDLSPREVKRIASHLETNQAEFFRASHRELAKDGDALRVALGIPPKEVWPSEKDLAIPSLRMDARFTPGTRNAKSDDSDDSDGDLERAAASRRDPSRRWNRGGKVFRVRQTRALRWGVWGAVIGLLPGGIVGIRLFGLEETFLAAVTIAGLAVGFIAGSRRHIDECSERQCEARIPDAESTCPKCGGTILGVIYDAADRLAVAEAVEQGRSVGDAVGDLRASRKKRARTRWLIFAAVALVLLYLMFGNRLFGP